MQHLKILQRNPCLLNGFDSVLRQYLKVLEFFNFPMQKHKASGENKNRIWIS